MVDLPQKKVGIVACSGEELPEGTITRLAALRVLEELRPAETVTICLPLFLAGGEGDRAFAQFYPTIALDGCEVRCAARATELHSGKPAASVIVSDLVSEFGLSAPVGCRRLNQAGLQAVEITANYTAEIVDDILEKRWSRRSGDFIESESILGTQEKVEATCACGSGIPIQQMEINGNRVDVIALPLIFESLQQAGKIPNPETAKELLDTVKIYNQIPADEQDDYSVALLQAYSEYYKDREPA